MSLDGKNIFQLGNEANEYSLNFARRPGIHEAAGQGEQRAVASSASTNYAALTRLNATQPPKQRQREAKKTFVCVCVSYVRISALLYTDYNTPVLYIYHTPHLK